MKHAQCPRDIERPGIACGSSENSGTKAPTSTATTPSATPEKTEAHKPATPSITVTIAGGKVTPKAKKVDVKAGEPVRLIVNSDVADELHVHSDPSQSFDIKAAPNQTFEITIKVPGQVEIEAEELGIQIVTLVIRP